MFRSICVICVGNLCRSPTAEILLRHALGGEVQVASAGLHAAVGRPMDPLAALLLAEHGLDGSGHVARQATRAVLLQADLILAMERRHLREIGQRVPEASGKALLLGKWLGEAEIADPYRRPRAAFEQAYADIERSVARWLPYLR